jgi:hypothetical protein
MSFFMTQSYQGFAALASKYNTMITVANFTNTLDNNQIAKGKVYYKEDAVEYLSENKPGYRHAELSA